MEIDSCIVLSVLCFVTYLVLRVNSRRREDDEY
jgi:hypothetical protein